MQNSILLQLLKTLQTQEKKSFLAFVESPYFGAKSELRLLAAALLSDSRQNLDLDKQRLYPLVFGRGGSYDDARMRKAMEQLLRLLERFLVTEQRNREDFDARIRLATAMIERKQDKLLRRLIALPVPLPDSEADWTADHFDQAARWNQLLYDYRSAVFREHDPVLYEKVLHYQTVAMLAQRLKHACIFHTNQKERAGAVNDPLLIWAVGVSGQYAKIPLLHTLFAAYRALQLPDDPGHFSQFHDGLMRHKQCFSYVDRRNLLVLAINFCSKRYNEGDRSWLDTQLDLYEYGLKEGFLLENQWVSGYTFTNIATLALIARRYERLETLLRDFAGKIAPRDRKDATAFNGARLFHAQGDYHRALLLLQQNIFDDLLINLSAKTVQAKCFYELREFEVLDAHMEALRKFIRRHKEVGYYGERYLNFIATLRKLVKITPSEFQGLRDELAAMPVLAEKEWLMEQLGT